MSLWDKITSLAGAAVSKIGDIFPFFRAFEGFASALQGAIKYSLTAQDIEALRSAIAHGREGITQGTLLLAELGEVLDVLEESIDDDGAVDLNEVQLILDQVDDLAAPAAAAADALKSATDDLRRMVK